MKTNDVHGAADGLPVNTLVIDTATARRFECVKERCVDSGSITYPTLKLLTQYCLK
jgi:hypothetical protein